MTEPLFVVRISDQKLSCQGKQFALILETILPYTKDATWYASDVVTNDNPPFKLGLQNAFPKKIGTTTDVIYLASNVGQFQSGVFLAFPKDQGSLINQEFATEDSYFRDIGDAIVEIRPFDTAYFEVYTSNDEIIKNLMSRFSESVIDYERRK